MRGVKVRDDELNVLDGARLRVHGARSQGDRAGRARRRELSEVDPPGVTLRAVVEEDLYVFFEQQSDPDANAMAEFPARDRQEHLAHWHKILDDDTVITRSILYGDEVAGNIVSWIQDGKREVGYWIGRAFWGQGIATSALRSFLEIDAARPLFAWVARHNDGSIRVLEKVGFVHAGEDGIHLIYRLG